MMRVNFQASPASRDTNSHLVSVKIEKVFFVAVRQFFRTQRKSNIEYATLS